MNISLRPKSRSPSKMVDPGLCCGPNFFDISVRLQQVKTSDVHYGQNCIRSWIEN